MTPVSPDLFCPACNEVVPAADARPDPEHGAPRCPVCTGLLRPDAAGFDNPITISVIMSIAGPIARLLKKTGVLQYLEARAAATENKIDDVAIRVVITIIDELAKL